MGVAHAAGRRLSILEDRRDIFAAQNPLLPPAYYSKSVDMTSAGSFSSVSAYGKALIRTPERLRLRAVAVSCAAEELCDVQLKSGSEMQRKLQWYDLISLGVGGMVGAGIFVTTGTAANVFAGPAVIIAYIVAGFTALLSALCYSEFAAEIPAAGGAFSYLRITFGEFAAYLTGANLILEYVVGNAAVARSFTSYLATVFGVSGADAWRIYVPSCTAGYSSLDILAVGMILLITVAICYSTKTSSFFNSIVTVVHLVFILLIIGLGFAKGRLSNLSTPGDAANASGFAPYGARGIFNAAAIVFFSYIGYDAVSTMAEEVQNPSKNMPRGIVGSVIIVTVLYCLLAASISFLVPYDLINPEAPFSAAFANVAGWKWASNVVGVGACLGILTSMLVGMLGQARYICVIGRANVIPRWFARINPETGTPINATLVLGSVTAVIALFTDLPTLLNLISIGTLFVFYMVASALIYRRHVVPGKTKAWPTMSFLVLLSANAIGFVCFWQLEEQQPWGLAMFGSTAMLLTTGFWYLVPCVHHPSEWALPGMPWPAAISMFLNIFLLGSVDRQSYIRFGVWSLVAILLYLLYGVHASYDAERCEKIPNPRKECVDGAGMELHLHPGSDSGVNSQIEHGVTIYAATT